MYQQAAIDISTGHAFDSRFRARFRDPWADDAVRIFVDIATNHDRALYPLPSSAAAANDSDDNLPEVFARARKPEWGIVAPLVGRTADSVTIDPHDIREQFDNFVSWLAETPQDLLRLRNWLAMHFGDRRIAGAHSITVPTHYVSSFFAEVPSKITADQLGLHDAEFEYAFDRLRPIHEAVPS